MPVLKRKVLTRDVVESAKPRASAYRLWDAKVPGLCLRVLPSGIKTFEAHLSRGQSHRLGRHPIVTLNAARIQARASLADPTGASRATRVETFGAFLDARYGPWVTTERKAGVATLANLRAQFGEYSNKPLSALTAWNVEKFKGDRLRAGVMPATVNRDLGRIKAALSKAVEWGLLTEHPLRTVKPAKGADQSRVRFLDQTEEKALRTALADRDNKHRARRESGNAWRSDRGRDALPAIGLYFDHVTPMTLLALNSGLRRGELTSITWADVDLAAKILTVRAGYAKSGKSRYVPLNSEAVDVLATWQKQHSGEGRLFPIDSVKKAWAALLVTAKISGFRFHDCRHSFASNLVMAGVDLNTVRELLGHATVTMTLRYAHLAPQHKAAAVERLVH